MSFPGLPKTISPGIPVEVIDRRRNGKPIKWALGFNAQLTGLVLIVSDATDGDMRGSIITADHAIIEPERGRLLRAVRLEELQRLE